MDALQRIFELAEPERRARGLRHTPREIGQQPETWRSTRALVAERASAIRELLARVGVTASGGATILLVGAGTSDYIGRCVAPLLRKTWRADVFAVPSTELLTAMDEFTASGRPSLWVSFSRSGDSSEGVALLEAALDRFPNVHHLIVTCNSDGRMARDFEGRPNVLPIVLDDAVNDRGLAMTSSFTNMVVAGHCLAHVLAREPYESSFERLVAAGRDLLPRAADAAERLVEEGFSKVCFLGTGALAGAAAEAALKVVELTAGRVTTFSESFLGVRHGPLSAVDSETLVVAFHSSDPRRRAYERDLLVDVATKRLAKKIVLVGPRSDSPTSLGGDTEELALLDTAPADDYRPAVDVIVAQLLGLFASLRLGLSPDTPSPSGAISRVVAKVKIY